mmetsp:Transcript_12446/g.34309  ORF Transcript_12446/g.34309 Transcript_12446/m.34309 type:complete len:277 (-) Transcript_12446:543-1373(-)
MCNCVMEEVSLPTKTVAITNDRMKAPMAKTRSAVLWGTISSVPPANCSRDQCRAVVYFKASDSSAKPWASSHVSVLVCRLSSAISYQRQAITCPSPMMKIRLLRMPAMMISCSDFCPAMGLVSMTACVCLTRSIRISLIMRRMRKVRVTLPTRAKPTKLRRGKKISHQSQPTIKTSGPNHVQTYVLAIFAGFISMEPSGFRMPVRRQRIMSSVQKTLVTHCMLSRNQPCGRSSKTCNGMTTVSYMTRRMPKISQRMRHRELGSRTGKPYMCHGLAS